MEKKIVNVKLNGKIVSPDTKIKGVHLCGNYCPINVSMSCPKVRTCGNLPLNKYYSFITDGKQIIEERNTREAQNILEATRFVVTKCKRYEGAISHMKKNK